MKKSHKMRPIVLQSSFLLQYTVVGPFWIAYSQIINAEVSDANVIWISFEIYEIWPKRYSK